MSKYGLLIRSLAPSAVLIWFALVTQICAAQAPTTVYIDLPAQELSSALTRLGQEIGTEIEFSPDAVRHKSAPALNGDYTRQQALDLLLKGSGLVARTTRQGAIIVGPAPATTRTSDPSSHDAKEAAATSGPPVAPSGAPRGQGQSSPTSEAKKSTTLEEVVVTGSRLPTRAKENAQEVKIYTREQIERSGQTTVSDFLNTLTEVSVSSGETTYQTTSGSTVQLHGLPVGSTLVLINGRRVEVAGLDQSAGTFDLNNIPMFAVERIEVLSEGSSAIYGSDAIAGVVNIILRNHLEGIAVDAMRGGAADLTETSADVGWGHAWGNGSMEIVGGVKVRNQLSGSARAITANNDYTAFGGIDARSYACNPGNVFSVDGNPLPGAPVGSGATVAAISPSATGNPRLTGFTGTYGVTNKCSLHAYAPLIPDTQRYSVLATGEYRWSPAVELFGELLVSTIRNRLEVGPAGLYGDPSYASFTVPDSNPYNPFGTTVGVAGQLAGLPNQTNVVETTFLRPLVGARGAFAGRWRWEVAAWESTDTQKLEILNNLDATLAQAALNSTDPATALNPFVAGPAGSPALLQSIVNNQTTQYRSREVTANGFIVGPVASLRSGPIDVVVGTEYVRDKFTYTKNSGAQTDNSRRKFSVFGEARLPLLASRRDGTNVTTLAVTVAGRVDAYNDVGTVRTPQYGVQWRPFGSLLIDGTYSESFQAPGMGLLVPATLPIPGYPVVDPKLGNQLEFVTVVFGTNPALKPETGRSHSITVAYSSQDNPDLQASAMLWSLIEKGSVQFFYPQTLVDNENLFASNVIRPMSCSGGPPCPITQVNALFLNFGTIDVAGLDYRLSYKIHAASGTWTPSLAATQTYRYNATLTPGAPTSSRLSAANDDGNFAPRWKASVGLGWEEGPYAASAMGRYVGRYRDYDSTRDIGNFWLLDANVHVAIGEDVRSTNQWLKRSYIELGGVNILDAKPQYSNFYFGSVGYDAAEADIRGRYIYVRVGTKW